MSRIVIVAISMVTVVGGLMVALNAAAQENVVPEQHKGHSSSSGCGGGGAKAGCQTNPAVSASEQPAEGGAQQCAGMMEKAGVPKQMMHHSRILMQSRIFLNDPGAIYGQAEILGLSEQQKKRLIDIQNEARRKALPVLTAEQREKMGDIPNKPLTMAVMCRQMCEKMMPLMQKEMGAESKPQAMCCPMCPMMGGLGHKMEKELQTPEQTTCPVMGGKVNKDIFTEYEGKKVYFCCPGCRPVFEKNPEKYISKLPQFQN